MGLFLWGDMSLTSSSTDAQVRAAYEDNADYDTTASVAKAKLFVQACRIRLSRMQDEVAHGDARVQESYQKIADQLDAATSWWSANDEDATTSKIRASVRHPDLRSIRS